MRKNGKTTGFTLIELLVVVAIISMLLGLVSVGLRKVTIVAKNLRQKSVFHGMEIGLELFSKDFDGYPDSRPISTTGPVIVGAQRFAEALVGRDGQGFDPQTDWYAPDDTGATGPYTDTPESMKRRKPLYLEFKHFEAHTLDEIYQTPAPLFTASGVQRAPILTDVFNRGYNPITNQRIGTPILYFKADSAKKEWEFRTNTSRQQVDPDAPDWPSSVYSQWVYNLDDNLPLLNLGFSNPDLAAGKYPRHFPDLENPAAPVQTVSGAFYRFITNREAATGPGNRRYRSFNPNTFILISAGYDGVYGTDDDITNFDY